MNHSIKPTAKQRAADRSQAGFTLLEVTIAFALFTFLIGGIFKIADASFQVSAKVTEKGQQEMHVAAFFDLMRRNFSSMPGNGKVTMAIPNSVGSSGYNTEIVMKDYPLAFSWGGVAAGSEKVLIVSEKDPLGGTQIRIRYLNEEESEAHDNDGLGDDEGQSLVLIAGIKSMYWQFFDQTEEEWIEEWDEENRRPSLVELNVEFFSLSEPIRAVFWIPVVANPESVVRGAQQVRPPKP
ncbi:MAG: type II secretion system protein J [Verrucomicrobiales bacterium]|jgi:type II secretion system protein J